MEKNQFKIKEDQKGAAALLVIVIISAALLIMAYNASLLGLGELDLGYTFGRGEEAFSVADGCMEEAFLRIHFDINYGVGAGDINLTVSNGSCIIQVADIGGSQRKITVLGTSGDYNKKIESEIVLNGNFISVNKWEEKND